MTKRNLFINVVFLLIVIIFSAISLCSCALSNKRLCYDPECSVPVSLARTSIKYTPNEPGLLPFDINVEVKVFSKEAGNRTDLWGVEINGKRGYVPKTFLREYKVLKNHLRHEVPTNQLSSDNNESNGKLKPKDDNDKSKNGAEVVSHAQTDNVVSNSTEEVSHDVSNLTASNNVIDGTVQLEHSKPTTHPNPVNEVAEATTIVPNEQGAVDNVTVTSDSKKVQSNIFATDDKLLKKILSGKVESNKKSFPEKVDIKDFVTSTEETLDVPEIAGVQVPPLNVTASVKDSAPEEIGATQSTESNATTEVKGTQSTKELGIIHVPEVSAPNYTKETVKEDVPTTDINEKPAIDLEGTNNTDSVEAVVTDNVKMDSETVQNITNSKVENVKEVKSESQLNTKRSKKTLQEDVPDTNVSEKPVIDLEGKNNTDSVEAVATDIKTDSNNGQNITNSEAENVKEVKDESQLKTEGTKETLKQDVPDINISEKPVIDLEGKNNTDSVEAVATDDIKTDSKTVQNITNSEVENVKEVKSESQLKTEQTKSKDETFENTLIKTDNTDSPVSSLLAESTVNNSTEVTLSSSNNEGTISEHITKNVEGISSELNLTTPLNSSEVEIIPDTTVSPIPQDANQSLEENNDTTVTSNNSNEELQSDIVQNVQDQSEKGMNEIVNETTAADILKNDTNEHINVINEPRSMEDSHILNEFHTPRTEEFDIKSELLISNENPVLENIESSNEFRNRNLLNADTGEHFETENLVKDETVPLKDEAMSEDKDDTTIDNKVLHEDSNAENIVSIEKATSENILHEVQAVSPPDTCTADNVECYTQDNAENYFESHEGTSRTNEYPIMEGLKIENSYWSTLMYLGVTATATLIFSLGYYYIENMRRDWQLIARINKLEKDLLVSTKECTILTESLKLTKDKLTSIEDESFGSNEMVLSLKADLEASQNAKAELEDQVAMLERDLEGATEAGLELERMLREFLSSDNEVNPLAQSVEDLQTRLNAQQAANESLTNALNLKTQENESLAAELASFKRKCEELEVELTQVTENLKAEENSKNSMVKTLTDKVQQLEMQIKEISTEKVALQKELKGKEVEIKDLMDVISRLNSNNLDFDKLYDVSRIKAEASVLLEERNELKERLTEVEGAHSLLEEHMKVVKEEVATLSEQCKIAEKEKKDAETRLEVLSSFFEEKEAQRQKEEAIWLQQQGEVVSTVERIQTMQTEIQNYKQQIEMLKREILDQEREYKNQISVLETKAHEQWVVARQVERRLEESKVEAGQLRNRLTLIEKNINDVDSEAKLHRLEANGDTTTSPPLFMGAESSSSPIMFSGSANVPPPPPPSYLHSLFPPYLPPPLPNASGVPPYEVSQRPPPLGGRLSSPPPMPLHPSSRYDNAGSPPPPMSPHLLPPFDHRSPPPPLFGGDHHIHPPPPPPGSILPPPLGTTHSWGEESLPHPRNSGFHHPQRERVRNHKGSLHSSGDSLDKTHHNSKV